MTTLAIGLEEKDLQAHESKAGAHQIAGVAGLQAALEALATNSGDPILSTKWVPLRNKMWTGYVPADGGVFSRTTYPEVWAAIERGDVPVVLEGDWQANPNLRGAFTVGNGSTSFRVPDLNGATNGSYGPVYLSGDGGRAGDNGSVLQDRVQNITGTFTGAKIDGHAALFLGGIYHKGAFYSNDDIAIGNSNQITGTSTTVTSQGQGDRHTSVTFDASRVVRTGDTTRPITAVGCWAIKFFGEVQNAGSVDAAKLATELEVAKSRITQLEEEIDDRNLWTNAMYVPDNLGVNAIAPGTPMSNTIAAGVGVNPLEVKPSQGIVIKDSGWYRVTGSASIVGGNGSMVMLRNGVAQWVQCGTSVSPGTMSTFTVIDAFSAGDLIDATTTDNAQWYDRRHWCITIERIG